MHPTALTKETYFKRAYTLIVNSVLSDLNMEQLMVSPSSVQRWETEAGVETVKEYDKELENLVCLKFDGGTEKNCFRT